MRKFLLAATVLLAFNGLVGLATSAYGIPFGPPSIVSGDKTFSGFDCTLTPSGPCNTMLAVVGRISTTPPDSAPGLFGLRFTGAFSNPPTSDLVISYHGLAAGALFHDIDTFFDGTAGSSIHEQVFNDITGTKILDFTVMAGVPPIAQVFATDVSAIFVEKDIALPIVGAAFSIVDQNFSQTVPEPASLAILAVSLLGMGVAFRRHRR